MKLQAITLEIEFWKELMDPDNYYHDSKEDKFQINYDRISLNRPELSIFKISSPLCSQYLNSMCIGCQLNCSNKYGTENYSNFQNFHNSKSIKSKIKNAERIYNKLNADLMIEIELTKINSKSLLEDQLNN
jgi:hypothetical protein